MPDRRSASRAATSVCSDHIVLESILRQAVSVQPDALAEMMADVGEVISPCISESVKISS